MSQPSLRLSDAQREDARRLLAQHRQAGRLTPAEAIQRDRQAATAVTVADLHPLFVDLPGGLPAGLDDGAAHAWPTMAPHGSTAPSYSPTTTQTTEWPTLPLGGTPDVQPTYEHRDLAVPPPAPVQPVAPAGLTQSQLANRRRVARLLQTFTSVPILILICIITGKWWILFVGIFVVPLIINALTGEDRRRR